MARSPVLLLLERLHERFRDLEDGAPASYIPELALANPAHFGISIATVDGTVYSVGDAAVPFTIQSMSKPLVYGLALDDNGEAFVSGKVGVEPSGEAFNAISLEAGTGRPRNPMINAGAIAMSSLVAGGSPTEQFTRTVEMLSRYAGRQLGVDEAVFRSEKDTGHRNRAIGHLLRNAGIIDGDIDAVCDRYFRQCAVQVTCADLATIGATLANGGHNPLTGERAVSRVGVDAIISIMSSCGMYDFAGAWVSRVGLPAKSGVGGGIIAVLPGQLGIGVFAPPLDATGNSVRGVAVCEALSREFALGVHRPPLNVGSAIRASYTLSEKRSKCRRTDEDAARLDAAGPSVVIIEAQGSIVLSTAEALIRVALKEAPAGGTLIIDFRRVVAAEPGAARLFGTLARELRDDGVAFAVSGLESYADWSAALREEACDAPLSPGGCYLDLDAALEACEESILGADGTAACLLSVSDHPVLQALPPAEAATLLEMAEYVHYLAGDRIIRHGDASDAVFLILSGAATVSVPRQGGCAHRITTLGHGTTFGEMALMDNGPRSADVHALTDVTCLAVPLQRLACDPALATLRLHMVEFLAQELAERLRRANAEIQALTR
ncbi:MAG: glutaminase A [Dehalococcoidia bacterium]